MTDKEGGEAAVVENTTTAAPEAALSSQEQTSEVDFEAEARKMGWVPEEEFKGDKRPAKFLSAEEYYRRGEEVIPIIRARNKALEKDVEDLKETNKRMSAMFEKTLARDRENARKEIEALKAAQKQAIRDGDDAKADQIDQQIDTLKEAAADTGKAASPKTQADLIKDFATVNTWFVEEPDMQEYAVKVSESNAALNEGISFEDNMKFVLGAVRKKFPDYFKDSKDTPAANGHAAVDTGGSFPGAQQAKDPLVAKLPKEAVAQMKRDLADKSLGFKSEAEWAKVYWE